MSVIQEVALNRLLPLQKRYRNTWIYDSVVTLGDEVGLILHNTRIVRIDAEGNVRLNSGGWRTVTTKRRMNEALEALGLDVSVYQEAFVWYTWALDDDLEDSVTFVDDAIVGQVSRG